MESIRVVPISLFVVPESALSNQNEEDTAEYDPVQKEKFEMLMKAEKRFQGFKKILYNQQIEKLPIYVAFYGIGGILLGIFTNLFTTVIPIRDAIKDPTHLSDYWPTRLIGFIIASMNMSLLIRYWINTRCMFTIKHLGLTFLLLITSGIFLGVISIGIWTSILGYEAPIPFQQMIISPIVVTLHSMSMWVLVPKEWKNNKYFRKRYKFFIANVGFQNLMYYEYIAMGILFDAVSDDYQWILSITLPFVREANIWIQEKLAHKSAGENDTSATIAIHHGVNTRHSVFLSVMVGSKATKLSSWIMLLTDFVYNLYLALKIVWIRKTKPKTERNDREMFNLLFSLTINELVEAVIPFTFLACFLSAFYGPNAEVIGGVKSTHFHYEPISDIRGFVQNMVLFLMVDICSVTFVGLILWGFCKINLIQSYMTIIREFWSIITVATAFSVYAVII